MGIYFILWALIQGCCILLHTVLALGFLAFLLSVSRAPGQDSDVITFAFLKGLGSCLSRQQSLED